MFTDNLFDIFQYSVEVGEWNEGAVLVIQTLKSMQSFFSPALSACSPSIPAPVHSLPSPIILIMILWSQEIAQWLEKHVLHVLDLG